VYDRKENQQIKIKKEKICGKKEKRKRETRNTQFQKLDSKGSEEVQSKQARVSTKEREEMIENRSRSTREKKTRRNRDKCAK